MGAIARPAPGELGSNVPHAIQHRFGYDVRLQGPLGVEVLTEPANFGGDLR